MYTEFDPYENYTIEDQARDLQISVEECKAYNASGMSWIEWINAVREVKYGVFNQFMMDLYDDLDDDNLKPYYWNDESDD